MYSKVSSLIFQMDPQNNPFTITQLGRKGRSKIEIYRILTTEGGIYLPPPKEVNYSYLRGILRGDIPYIEGNEVKNITVPHFEALTVDRIAAFARQHFELDAYLPKRRNEPWIPNRNFLCNLVNTKIEKEFREFIREGYHNREIHIIRRKRLELDITPKFIQIFQNSSSVSHDTGRSHFLMKDRKRRREQVEDDERNRLKEEVKDIKQAKFQAEEAILDLKRQILELEEDNKNYMNDSKKLHNLYQIGMIDGEGDPKEHE